MNENFAFRYATADDVEKIMFFIKELAEYQKLGHEVVANEDMLREWLFERKIAEVIFALCDGKEVGFAMYYFNFSTFLGRGGLHLEDLYVSPEYRGRGFGKAMLARLASIAVERDFGRLEWCCLDWNVPSIEFYVGLGAVPMSEWTTYRLEGERLNKLARLSKD